MTVTKSARGHPLFARYYARVSPLLDRGLVAYRTALLADLSGEVIEIGAGTGSNFAHYPLTARRVLAVEPESHLRRPARAAAARAPVPIEIVAGVAEHLPAADESFDAAVLSLVLCTVPDQTAALAEIVRVLRPGGQLRIFEHVRADTPVRRRVQRALDATLWPRVVGGCRTCRDTVAAVREAGFEIERLDRLGPGDTGMPFPIAPQVLCWAVRR
ncbi:MAG: class I SAM-dependent methyltransferase [Actinoallomurus sp.]